MNNETNEYEQKPLNPFETKIYKNEILKTEGNDNEISNIQQN